MAAHKLTGKELRKLGYPEGRLIGTAMRLLESSYRGKSKKFKLDLLERVIQTPALYLKHEHLGVLAQAILARPEKKEHQELKKTRLPYTIYGAEMIEPGALHQMELAMKLPVTLAGALMPDAHQA